MSRGLGRCQRAVLKALAEHGAMTTDAIASCCGARDVWRSDIWQEEQERWQFSVSSDRDEEDEAHRKWRSALSSIRRALATMQSAGLVQRESLRDGLYGQGQYPWAITEAGWKFIERRTGLH